MIVDAILQAFSLIPQKSHAFARPNYVRNVVQMFSESQLALKVPPDATSPNDTSWLALAVECVRCGVSRIVYDDETH